jgi:hypothetical protein
MTDDQKKTLEKEDRLEKAKGRLQQPFPDIQQRIRRSGAVEIAQSIFRQFADDIQLKDLLAKAETLVGNTNLGFPKAASNDTPPAQTFRDVTSSVESPGKTGLKKTPPKAARPKKAAPKNTAAKKKKTRAPKRKARTRA